MLKHVLAFALVVAGCGSKPVVMTPTPDMTMPSGDPDARVVDPPACVGGWLVANVPRAGGNARYAFGPDEKWQLVYQAPVAGLSGLGVRHVAEATIADADTVPSAGESAIAVGRDGTVAIFVKTISKSFSAFKLVAGQWQPLGPPFGTPVPSSSALAAIDGAGTPHVVFDSGFLYHASFVKGAWNVETVGSQKGTLLSDFVVDDADHLHVISWSSNASYWATNASGAWQVTALPSTPPLAVGRAGVDHAGRMHVLGTNKQDGSRHHLWLEAGAWHDETMPTSVGIVESVTIDAANHIHAVGTSATYDVVYSTNASGSWVSSTVASVGANARSLGWIALDGASRPHVAFDSLTVNGEPPHHHFAQPCP